MEQLMLFLWQSFREDYISIINKKKKRSHPFQGTKKEGKKKHIWGNKLSPPKMYPRSHKRCSMLTVHNYTQELFLNHA